MIKERNKGLALVITMGVLLVLSTTGVTFVRMTSYERTAASNYKDRVEAKLAAFAGIDHAVAVLFEQAKTGSVGQPINGVAVLYPHAPGDTATIDGQQTDIFDLDNAMRGGGEATPPLLSLHDDVQGEFSYSGLVGRRIGTTTIRGTYEDSGNLYGIKITDIGGRLNVNSHISVDQAGNPLANEQIDSNRIMRNLIQTLAGRCGIASGEATTLAAAIRPNDASVPNFNTTSIEALVTDLCTSSTQQARDRFLANVCVNSRIDQNTAKASLVDNSTGNPISPQSLRARDYRTDVAPQFVREMRAPININRASEELVATLIENLKAIPVLLLSRVQRSIDGTFAENTAPGSVEIRKETSIDHRIPRLEVSFTAAQALNIAQFLVGKTYSTSAQINEEIDRIQEIDPSDGVDAGEAALLDSSTFFPAFPTVEVKTLFGGAGVLFGDADADLVRLKILWKRACRDILKSNFNPNVIDNFWNPNLAVRMLGVKSNLFGRDSTSVTGLIVAPLTTPIVNHHTTELTAFDDGVYEITSSSRITANNGQFVAGACTFRSELRLFDVVEHTTQQDFVNGGNFGSDAISFPGRHNTTFISPFAGRVEPRPQLINPINTSNVLFNTGSASESSAPNNSDHFLGSTNRTLTGTKAQQIVKISETNSIDTMIRQENIIGPNASSNIVNDGLVSTARYYNSQDGVIDGLINGITGAPPVRYYSKYALDNASIGSVNSSDSNGNNSARLRDADASGDADAGLSNHRVGNYRGTMEFWIKLAIDGDSPTECGILSFSTVGEEKTGPTDLDDDVENDPGDDDTFREGTQTFLVKDTEGRLKLTRYYYCGYFGKNNGENATIFNRNGDIERRFAKRDVSIDISDWLANTWHHVIISWDDKEDGVGDESNQGPKFEAGNNFANSLSLIVDNQAATDREQSYFGIADRGNGDPRFVVCAERDVFTVGSSNSNVGNGLNYILLNGVFRRQNSVGNTNKFFQHSSGVYLGNATIDNFISYEGNHTRSATLNRFSPTSTYTNSIAINRRGILGTLRWTAYNNSGRYDITQAATVEGSATLNGNGVFAYPASKTDPGGDGSGLPANGSHVANEGDAVVYSITFRTPSNVAGAVGSICAALDSVQVTVINFEHLSFEEIQ
ncbi:pilus assembly PilX N-terminal domain-containing protein [Candidatus Uabimicrobium amorphum]|uniref:Type 4 fimbrial biogenesis protein PilX N-terminal domain-containing protein n=1 Tax=Uabimicrobium amorphum TaxID=2596890 RepID=A0A5S9IJ95_UABAM|nr:pilus assembly PilX N-terminal domain-containing protein [Candidatus Uabimicrobium amorphum]BBM82402.1 hypothetical protein UABAM_00745 [Candidatus Uabimicrobium amorphum]